jgi:zinc transport system substrate-binding protein
MRLLPLALLLLPAMARAEVPVVAVDIAPVHSLVARVMQGVGTPDLVIPSGASPHGYAMRPSEARSLSRADLVVWVGPALTSWLAEPLDALAPKARKLALIEAEGISLLAFREGVAFGEGGHDHGHADAGHDEDGHDEDGHDDHGHEDEAHADAGHDDHGHDEDAHDEAGHDDHGQDEDAHDEDGHDDHAHDEDAHDDDGHDDHGHEDAHEEGHEGHGHEGGSDPHIWLDPANAAASLDAIAGALAALDPENAAIYQQNAKDGQAEMAALTQDIAAALSGAQGQPFIVFHDAFHYFEARFDVEAAAAVSAGDAATPGPARVSALRDQVANAAPVCAFAEPQMNTSLMQTVLEGQDTRLATLDPLGAALPLGPTLYPELMLAIAGAMAACLNP